MNRHLAKFYLVAHLLYKGNVDAVRMAANLVDANKIPFSQSRNRMWEALEMITPPLARALREADVDLRYVAPKDVDFEFGLIFKEYEKCVKQVRQGSSPKRGDWPQKPWRKVVWDMTFDLGIASIAS